MAVIGGFDAMSLENTGFLSESKRSHTLRGGLYVLVGIGALYRNGLCLNRRHIYSIYTQWLTILQRMVCVLGQVHVIYNGIQKQPGWLKENLENSSRVSKYLKVAVNQLTLCRLTVSIEITNWSEENLSFSNVRPVPQCLLLNWDQSLSLLTLARHLMWLKDPTSCQCLTISYGNWKNTWNSTTNVWPQFNSMA